MRFWVLQAPVHFDDFFLNIDHRLVLTHAFWKEYKFWYSETMPRGLIYHNNAFFLICGAFVK